MNGRSDILKSYVRLCITVMLIVFLIICASQYLVRKRNKDEIDLYKVEISRIENELTAHAGDPSYEIDVSKYKTITGVYKIGGEDAELESLGGGHCAVRRVDGELYRIEYEVDMSRAYDNSIIVVNVISVILILVSAGLLALIYIRIIRTFNRISEYPYALAKGHMTIPLKDDRNRYFGRFLWGLDMLREKLEEEDRKNLELQKERNMFLLSLSHDIKTPISAIKLYAAAVKKGLYKDGDKLNEVAGKIDSNAGDIEEYVSKVIRTSGDDFLEFDVKDEEFYLSETVETIRDYYTDKLDQIGTELTIGKYSDLLIRGDRDRLTEVLQNIFENAIKYGDGSYIRMSFSDEEDARLITIENSGCTLKSSEIDHIFDSFFRGSNAGNRPGSGLGLYICRKLMNKMGGEIYAEAEGGVMRVTLVLIRR